MSPEVSCNNTDRNMQIYFAIILWLSMLIGCSNVSHAGKAVMEASSSDNVTDFTPDPVYPSISTSGSPLFDSRQLGEFINKYGNNFPGCIWPSPQNPLLIAEDMNGVATKRNSLGFVKEGEEIIYLNPGQFVEVRKIIHEFHHARCGADVADRNLLSWSVNQRSFVFTDRNYNPNVTDNVTIKEQQGFHLTIQVGGNDTVLTAVEEMAASSFALEEINQIAVGYSPTPMDYKDLFVLTHDYLRYYTKSDYLIPYQEMLDTLNHGFEKGKGRSDGYTIVFQELENLLKLKGVVVDESFRTGIIQYYYAWQVQRESAQIDTKPKLASTFQSQWIKNLVINLTDDVLRGDSIAFGELVGITNASTKAKRNLLARKSMKRRYKENVRKRKENDEGSINTQFFKVAGI